MTGRLLRKKVLLLGEIGVGKTSLVRRLTLGLLPTDYKPTSGVSIYTYRRPVPGPDGRERLLEFAIWDTDGMLGDSIFRHEYSEGAAGALIIGDVERRSTLDHVVDLAHKFQAAMPSRSFKLVVNKADKVVSRDNRHFPAELRDERWCPLWTSALSGEGVEPAFIAAGREILRREP
jgi:GTPase SAR1 family protein